MAWDQLELEAPHIAYACVGIFCTLFSLVSLFVKERLYIGEATVATIAGLIIGPHCLDWFNPIEWGNSDFITLEICRIVLCIQIIAVAVELPKKYMQKHWISVFIFLVPVMTTGWLVVGLFIWCLIPHFTFNDGLLVSACVTATDPVLAAAVVGKGKFAERVPGHLRNLLSAESGCNDGMAFPFIYLSLYLITYSGRGGEIVKNWFLLTILWECIFGCFLGVVMGFVLRKLVAFAETKNLIDRESFLAIFVFLAFNCAGIGSMLGVDDLLVSFAAGTAFGWNGDFAKKTEESHVSTVIDLLLNLSFFVYFGAIIPWEQFNDVKLGLNVWRLIILAFVIIFLRRVPAVVLLKPITPDVKTWREAFFCGHFGPIGVGAIFASILARSDLEKHYTTEETPLHKLPNEEFPHYQLLAAIWPMVCFIVVTSIIVHGSSVAVLTLGKRLNRMAITMSYTRTTGNDSDNTANWIQRLQKLDRTSSSFSLQRVDTMAPEELQNLKNKAEQMNVPETSGLKVRPAGGAKRRTKKKKKHNHGLLLRTLSRVRTGDDQREERHRPVTESLQLGGLGTGAGVGAGAKSNFSSEPDTSTNEVKASSSSSTESDQQEKRAGTTNEDSEENGDGGDEFITSPGILEKQSGKSKYGLHPSRTKDRERIPTAAYQEGDNLIVEDQHGEILDNLKLNTLPVGQRKPVGKAESKNDDDSIHSMESLQRRLSQYSIASDKSRESMKQDEMRAGATSGATSGPEKRKPSIAQSAASHILPKIKRTESRRTYYKKDDPKRRKVYAHRIDNLILIENEDGDIIRRYKVNRHASNIPKPNRSRSSTLVGKMKSFVGMKDKEQQQQALASSLAGANGELQQQHQQQQQQQPTVHVTDLEKGTHHTILVPQDDEKNQHSPHLADGLDKVEDKIAGILESRHQHGGHELVRRASPPPPIHGDINEEGEDEDGDVVDDDDENGEDSEEYDTDSDEEEEEEEEGGDGHGELMDDEAESDEEETSVERARRLQALGRIPNRNRDEDDEEEDVVSIR
ncbi:hypothetical protein LELG_04287 [Lodderomyces elongisporus NRRL YB-4239]|uniref:Na(+)/H(+) antiporter n=1 Tax=Lodderomyces elongisporus (strain ATCC 11503 / CBS 2605 / JCM 1781 / NBRC 1676 / NRRL YB-4239) TaxID=379508 RepID=A5E3U9_LODEL|nr:hypothetical protein LELG_04287 [Lodderomyces elongisporus NRRL YB-4239]